MAVINGTINNDTLKGGAGNDLIAGLAGNDRAVMRAGNDVFVWNPGDGNDTVEGGLGSDTLRFFGDDNADIMDISASGARARIHRSADNSTQDINDVERIDLRTRGGADLITINNLAGTDIKQVAIDLAGTTPGAGDGAVDGIFLSGTKGNNAIGVALVSNRVTVTGLPAQVTVSNAEANDILFIDGGSGNDVFNASSLPGGHIKLNLNGGAGNDQIIGSKGNDILDGHTGNDTITGGKGDDKVFLRDGNDLFVAQAGDGLDIVDGGAGTDTVRFTGAQAADHFYIGEGAGQIYFSRNGVSHGEYDDVERLQIRTLGGADTVEISDVTGSEVREIAVDLAATAGGTTADTKADTVWVYGSGFDDDVMEVRWINGQLRVIGLTAEVSVAHAGTNDTIIVDGAVGNDTLNASTMPAGKVRLQLHGEDGEDVIFGSAGHDVVIGGTGNDVAFMGAGNDQFIWNNGDGNDRVEGQAGIDTFVLGYSDRSFIEAAADRVHVRTDAGDIIDLDGVERIRIQGGKSPESYIVDDISGTDVSLVTVNLIAGNPGGDEVLAHGTEGNDHIIIATSPAGVVSIAGLAAQVLVTHGEAGDVVTIESEGGNDIVDAASMPATSMRLYIAAGEGNDRITGGAGNDGMIGEAGNDTLRGGGGADYLDGENGDDSLDGGLGNDTLLGGTGDDVILGSLGDDQITGQTGDDTLTGGAGSDTFHYTHTLDGHDVILDFDGDATGGQDVLNLDGLFDLLGVADGFRNGLVDITDNGGTVDVRVNADGLGDNGFELHVATLHTNDVISVGQDIVVVG